MDDPLLLLLIHIINFSLGIELNCRPFLLDKICFLLKTNREFKTLKTYICHFQTYRSQFRVNVKLHLFRIMAKLSTLSKKMRVGAKCRARSNSFLMLASVLPTYLPAIELPCIKIFKCSSKNCVSQVSSLLKKRRYIIFIYSQNE